MKRIENALVFTSFLGVLLMISFPENFLIMLARSLALQIMMLLLGLAIWLLFRRRWRIVSFPLVGVVFLYLMIGGTLRAENPYNPAAEGLKVAHFNVLKYAAEHDSTVQLALRTDADLISFQEVDHAWAVSLTGALSEKYPYRILEERNHTYGLAVFSKHPFVRSETLLIENVPNIAGTVLIDGARVNFIASHLKAPLSVSNFGHRRRHMEKLSDYVDSLSGPTVVMGDFNTVPWDTQMQRFVRETELSDSRRGLSATYPSYLPLAAIPIDYILYSEEIECAHFEVLEATSSDHLGIVGTYRIQDARMAEEASTQNLNQ